MPILVQPSRERLAGRERLAARRLLAAGVILLAVTAAGYGTFVLSHPTDRWLDPFDLNVYRMGGQVAAHIRPRYNPRLASPLYDWPGRGLKFTYPPFAAVIFTIFAVLPWHALQLLWLGVSGLGLAVTIWVTLGGLGYRAGAARIGGTLLLAAVLFWTEPVQRTLYLGQVEIVLMALVMWDLCQPEGRRWQGIGVGLAAGIKLVPLVFLPYLLFTRRYRQAAVAAAAFAVSAGIGFAVMPADSHAFWLDGLLFRSGRTGFAGWAGNQSLAGIVTRLAGSISGAEPAWLALAVIVLIAGVACAVVFDRAGHRVPAVLTCALTGLLVSPISWDHHWVWIVPGVTALACYGLRAAGRLRWAWLAAAVLVTAVFAAWPGFLWGEPHDLGTFSEGLIWAPPSTLTSTFARLGDRPWYAEYHWHGFQLVTGNLFVLTGVAVLVIAGVTAARMVLARRDVPASGLVAAASAVSR